MFLHAPGWQRLLLCATLAGTVAASSTVISQRPEPQPTFRAQVDVMTLDVTVLYRNGVPVEDLRPADFVVKVGDETRRVISAELSTVNRGTQATAPIPVPPRFFSTNATPVTGRKVMFAVDQMQIAPGSLAPLIEQARAFLDDLLPYDQVALVAFPPPGPRVPFTTDKARVHAALRMELGNRTPRPSDIPMSLWEAVRISDREMSTEPGVAGPESARVLERMGCDTDPRPECDVRLIKNEATVVAQTARTEGRLAIAELESLLDQLALVDGPKTLVLLSAGMFAEDANAMREAVRRAARARATIHVVALEPRLGGADGGDQGPPASTLQDRQLELGGLQEAAAGTGGSVYRPGGNGAAVFTRIASEISASYVLSIDARPEDRTRDRVDVSVRRRGLTVRATTSLAAVLPRAPRQPADALSDVLSSPVAVAGLPIRMTTFTHRVAGDGQVRVTVAADIGQPAAPPAEYSIGYALTRRDGGVVSRGGATQQLTAGPREPARYSGSLLVEPGSYTMTLGVVDAMGNRGSAMRDIEVAVPAGNTVGVSDLMVGRYREGEALIAAVEPRVDTGSLGLYVEVYPPADQAGDLQVLFEIGEGELTPALLAVQALMSDGGQAPWRIARGRLDAALPPGRYVARARVQRAGVTAAVVARPFVLERNTSAPPSVPDSSSYSPELPARTAAYVHRFVQGLANVVAQEDFDLRKNVRSDFLLVRYPGSDQELLAYRDVYEVEGKQLAGREERLADLFIKPVDTIRDRVRQIVSDGEEHVPAMLNPLYALSFLQAAYQSRFRFTVADAKAPWPDGVKAVSFVETRSPTLLRAGFFSDFDLPTRGTAWIEEATGRVFQTELEILTARDRPYVLTTFKLDERLQVMVPAEMRTRNPDGRAVYSNFRQFNVSADGAVK
jgi:VWFA-related protein